MTTQPRGPYVQAAFFCERLLIEPDGVVTAVRIVDQIGAKSQGPRAPADLPPWPYELTGLISLKPGNARGRQNYTVLMETPDGIRHHHMDGSITFAGGPNNGANLRLKFTIVFTQEGLYWFDLLVEDQLLTRMPLEVMYERSTGGTPIS